MDRHLPVIGRSPLFDEHRRTPTSRRMLQCLGAREAHAPHKGPAVLPRGRPRPRAMGLVLEGAVRLEKEDYWGNRSDPGVVRPGPIVRRGVRLRARPGPRPQRGGGRGRDLCCSWTCGRVTSHVPVRRARSTRGSSATCWASWRRRAHALTRKIEHTSQRTTRAKLLSYLSDQAEAADASRFAIPFDRQELADYLSVDRSAMCAELSRMRKGRASSTST